MAQILFKNDAEITDQWVNYYAAKAQSLSQNDEFTINNRMDVEAFNPDMKDFLEANLQALEDEMPDTAPAPRRLVFRRRPWQWALATGLNGCLPA